jgi:microcystin-dependent protein
VAHSHTFGLEAPVDASFSNGTTDLQVTGGSQVESALGTSAPSNATGGGSPFNNMQPSLALLYCQKE